MDLFIKNYGEETAMFLGLKKAPSNSSTLLKAKNKQETQVKKAEQKAEIED
jgi:hypothetical protein